MFVIAQPDLVQVIYSLAFVDKVDQELARVFSVEFAESGRRVQKAPGVNFYPPSRKPDELRNMPHDVDENCIGYLVFAVTENHVNTPVWRAFRLSPLYLTLVALLTCFYCAFRGNSVASAISLFSSALTCCTTLNAPRQICT